MLSETKLIQKSLSDHANKRILKIVIEGCKEHKEVRLETGLEITDQRDFQAFLESLKKTQEDMERLNNVTLKKFKNKSFMVESVDGWCKENNCKMSFEDMVPGERFLKQTQDSFGMFNVPWEDWLVGVQHQPSQKMEKSVK